MDYVEIGKLQKTHGLKGEIKGVVEERYWPDLAEVEAIFLDERGAHMPYFIESIRGQAPLIFKFEEVDTKELAGALSNKVIYLRRSDVQLSEEEIAGGGLEYGFLNGYSLHLEAGAEAVGKIEAIDEYPQQEMATVALVNGEEALIPLLPHWIAAIDKTEKQVIMDLPEGLLEL